ncbi:MAG: hypothetical protein WA628_12395 [Terriglobales bacterium]
MAAILYFLAAAVSAWVWGERISNRRNFAQGSSRLLRLLAWAVLVTVLVLLPVHGMAAAQIAGWIPAMRLWGLVGLQAAILVGTLAWSIVRPVPKLTSIARVHDLGDSTEFPPYLLACGAFLACSYLVFAGNLLTSYPSGWDALAYHFPIALHWLQTASLRIPPSRGWQYGLPGNAEIGMMWLLSTGRQSLVPLVNVFAGMVLATATYLIADRVVGGNKSAAGAATVIAVSLPIVQFQVFSGYVDLFGTAFLMAAVALFLYRNDGALEPRSLAGLLLSAVACGISVGTKPVFYLYAAVFCLAVAATLWREAYPDWRTLVRALFVIVAGILLPSLFWFGRAFQASGNPVFPLQVKLGQHVIFKGFPPSQITPDEFSNKFVRRRAEWAIYPWTEWFRSPGNQLIPYSEGSGVGAVFAAFVPLALLFAVYRSVFGAGGQPERILLVVWLGLLVLWWISLQRMPRFGLPLWILACALSAPLLAFFQKFRERSFGILLVGCLIATCGISAFVPLRELAARVRRGTWRRCEAYAYPHFIDELPSGSRLLNNTGIEEANFTLSGERLSNQVVADFDVPDPITPQFLSENHIDFVVEAIPENGIAPGMHKRADFVAGRREDLSASVGGKRWRIWKVEAANQPMSAPQ